MRHPRHRLLFFAALMVSASSGVHASTQALYFGDLVGAKTVVNSFGAGDVLFVDTTVPGATGALDQSVTFTLNGSVNRLSGQAGWFTTTAAGIGPRLTGFNIDIVDVATNTTVASDSFAGVLAGVAHSTFDFALGAGTYRLQASGTANRQSVYDLALAFGGTPLATSATGSTQLPVQGASTPGPTAFFSTLNDTRTMSTAFVAGQTLIVDTFVTGSTGSSTQTVQFVLAEGVEEIEGLASWINSTVDGVDPRLVGVNIDLLDSLGTVLFSDSFAGVQAGFAQSTFAGALGPGAYRLRMTGTGQRDSSIDIALSFRGVAPNATVPEPETAALLALGLAGAWRASRRRRAPFVGDR